MGQQVLLIHSSWGYSGLHFNRRPLSTRYLGVFKLQSKSGQRIYLSVYGILPILNTIMYNLAVLLLTSEVPHSNLGYQIIFSDWEFHAVPQSHHWHTSILPWYRSRQSRILSNIPSTIILPISNRQHVTLKSKRDVK